MNTKSIYLFDPSRERDAFELLAGSERRTTATLLADGWATISLTVVDSEQCVFFSDMEHNRLRHMTLPPRLFGSTGTGAGPSQ